MIQSTDIEVIKGNDFLARFDFKNRVRWQIFQCVHYSASFSVPSFHRRVDLDGKF